MTYSSLQIRYFADDDASQVLDIRRRNLEQADKNDYSIEIIQKMIDTLTCEKLVAIAKDPQRIILVAVNNSQVVGSASLYEDNVRLMFVDPDFQHKGIGTQLLQIIEKVAKEKGIAKLSLKSSLPAEGFYQGFGYLSERRESTPDMGPVILMSKSLG
jgi:histone acetyltransferase (RNA polymerase elongator complex component)